MLSRPSDRRARIVARQAKFCPRILELHAGVVAHKTLPKPYVTLTLDGTRNLGPATPKKPCPNLASDRARQPQAEDGGTPGQLISFWKADQDRPIEFANIEAWLKQLV